MTSEPYERVVSTDRMGSNIDGRAAECVEHGLQFLLLARDDTGIAWGLLPGDAADLHYSSLAMAALGKAGDQYNHVISEVGDTFVLPGYASYDFRSMSLDNQLAIVRATGLKITADDAGPESLAASANDRCCRDLARWFEQGGALQSASPRELAKLLLAIAMYGRSDDAATLGHAIGARLLSIQVHDGDESWWAVPKSDFADLVGTALAVVALRRAVTPLADGPLDQSSRYLLRRLVETGWEGLVPGVDVYPRAVVLRALAASRSPLAVDPLKDGIDYLMSLQHEDGGWGPSPSVSTVEDSSHAIISIFEAASVLGGGVRPMSTDDANPSQALVTGQLANGRIRELLTSVDELRAEVAEMRRLLRQMQSQTALLSETASSGSLGPRLGGSTVRHALAMSRSDPPALRVAVTGTALALLVAVMAAVFDISSTLGVVPALLLGVVGLASFIAVLIGIYRFANGRLASFEFQSGSPVVAEMVESFWIAVDGMPRGRVSQLLMAMDRYLAELPEDLVQEEYQRLLQRVIVGANNEHGLQLWVDRFAQITPPIRRTILRALRGVVTGLD